MLFDEVCGGAGGGCLRLKEQRIPLVLVLPCLNKARQGAVLLGDRGCGFAGAGSGIELFDFCLPGDELLLDFCALVAGGTCEVAACVVEFVVIQAELCLRDVEVIAAFGGELLYGVGVGCGDVLELRDLGLQGEGFSGEGALLEGGGTKSRGEGLVDIVVGEMFCLAREREFLLRDGEGAKGDGSLPGGLVDEGLPTGEL